ncbi:MAG: EamA family transporter [Acidobacteriia bacterium]|nr:EamA family transporter [Terriglobia bacterium]
MALETFSPTTLVCFRYLTSGLFMLIVARIAGWHIPRGRELWLTAFFGVVTLGIGNGCLAFAEQWVPSGLAALFVTTSPFWLVGTEALAPRGEPLHAPTIKGMLVGVAGVAFLVAPAAVDFRANPLVLGAFLLLQFGCAGWAVGSIAQRKTSSRAHPFVSGAVQQLATGIVYSVPAAIRHDPIHWSPRGIGAIIYLMIFGSIVGYSAYVFAMDRLPVAVASIYTYVNPIVAVILGWLLYNEPFGVREAIAMVIIFAGVAMVKKASSAPVPVEKLGADRAAESGQYGE